MSRAATARSLLGEPRVLDRDARVELRRATVSRGARMARHSSSTRQRVGGAAPKRGSNGAADARRSPDWSPRTSARSSTRGPASPPRGAAGVLQPSASSASMDATASAGSRGIFRAFFSSVFASWLSSTPTTATRSLRRTTRPSLARCGPVDAARRNRAPRREALEGRRSSSVARVGGTHRAAVGRSKRPSGAHVVGARGEMPGRDASSGERVRETREDRDAMSVRGGSVRAARRAHGTSPRCGGVSSDEGERLFFNEENVRDVIVDGNESARFERVVVQSDRVRRSRLSCARAPSPPPRSHTTPPSRRRRSTSTRTLHSQRLRSRAISRIVTERLSHDHGRRGSRRGGGRRARPRGREAEADARPPRPRSARTRARPSRRSRSQISRGCPSPTAATWTRRWRSCRRRAT